MRCRFHCVRLPQYRCVGLVILVLILKCCFDLLRDNSSNTSSAKNLKNDVVNDTRELALKDYYKYPLENGRRIAMDLYHYNSSYYWFMAMKSRFKNIGTTKKFWEVGTKALCDLWPLSNLLGPITVDKREVDLEWVAKINDHVEPGGYFAPTFCRARQRVAIIVPYRDRRVNLGIFLLHIHKYLRQQLLEYRIFVIEQYGKEKFNKGTLYNAAFLETQRFGTWDCLIFHDVDLIPEDERISYSCPEHPTQILTWGNRSIGIVTAMLPDQYQAVNGYSNMYVDSDLADFDFSGRLEAMNYTILKRNDPVARFRIMANITNHLDDKRASLIAMNRLLLPKEGLSTTKYKMIRIDQDRLFTYILAFSVNDILLQYDPLKEK